MSLKATCSIVGFGELLSPALSIPLRGKCCSRLARGSRIERQSGLFFVNRTCLRSHVSGADALWRGRCSAVLTGGARKYPELIHRFRSKIFIIPSSGKSLLFVVF